jgi:hypothetical protein
VIGSKKSRIRIEPRIGSDGKTVPGTVFHGVPARAIYSLPRRSILKTRARTGDGEKIEQ